MRVLKFIWLLLLLPTVPFMWAWSRSVQRSTTPDLASLPPDVGVAAFALQLLTAERQARGLEPLDRPRIVVCLGDQFDSVSITFTQHSLQHGEEQMFQAMSQLGAFRMTPKIQQSIEEARERARLERLRARN